MTSPKVPPTKGARPDTVTGRLKEVRRNQVCTRVPSGSRASTQGDVASTPRPKGATMRSIRWRTASSHSNRRSATLSIRRFRTTYTSRFGPTLPQGIGGIVASRRWWPDKSSNGRRTSRPVAASVPYADAARASYTPPFTKIARVDELFDVFQSKGEYALIVAELVTVPWLPLIFT